MWWVQLPTLALIAAGLGLIVCGVYLCSKRLATQDLIIKEYVAKLQSTQVGSEGRAPISVFGALTSVLLALMGSCLLALVLLSHSRDQCLTDFQHVTFIGNVNTTAYKGSLKVNAPVPTVFIVKRKELPRGGGEFAIDLPFDRRDSSGFEVLLSVNNEIVETIGPVVPTSSGPFPVRLRPVQINKAVSLSTKSAKEKGK